MTWNRTNKMQLPFIKQLIWESLPKQLNPMLVPNTYSTNPLVGDGKQAFIDFVWSCLVLFGKAAVDRWE
jgi:predicted SnoaL-like aldol condensation-catalyzing enzyme